MKKVLIIMLCILLLSGCSCTANDEIKTIDFSDFKTIHMLNEVQYLPSSESSVTLNKVPMPDFGLYNIKCIDKGEYRPQVPDIEFIEETTGTIWCYTIYKNTAYFVISYDIYHEFSHIVKVFSLDLENQILSEIYKYEDVNSSIYVSDIYVGEDGIYFISLKNNNSELYYIEKLNTVNNIDVVYSCNQELALLNQSVCLTWYEGKGDMGTVKSYDNGTIISLIESCYIFRGAYPYIQEESYYYIDKDTNNKSYANINCGNSLLRIDNLSDNSSFKYASDEELIWLSWSSDSDYTNPYLCYADIDKYNILSLPISKLGVHYSDACINGKIFIHLIRDNILGKDNDFFENVYYIDMLNETVYNLTENEIGSNTSLVRVEYDRLHTQNEYLFFFSRYNSSEYNADYKYHFFYWCDVS